MTKGKSEPLTCQKMNKIDSKIKSSDKSKCKPVRLDR